MNAMPYPFYPADVHLHRASNLLSRFGPCGPRERKLLASNISVKH